MFDKIEADVGVGEMIAHFYFTQLVSAVGYMHSKGVAHRDIKPENMLLSDGDLKLADFGLAALFSLNGQRKACQTICGSPPYMAPEVVPKEGFGSSNTNTKTAPYEGDAVDVWSCGIVLFVLLVGNTPWDEPTVASYEFDDYVRNGPQPTDGLWAAVPTQALSLLKGMLKVNPRERFNLEDVRRHPWFTQRNIHLSSDGRAANPVVLATQMLESLRIDFSQDPTAASSQRRRAGSIDAMDIDSTQHRFGPRLALTQPEAPLGEMTSFDWELPNRVDALYGGGAGIGAISASQPITTRTTTHALPLRSGANPRNSNNNGTFGFSQHLRLTQPDTLSSRLLADPALSQFSSTPSVPISVTQQARRFNDIIPAAPLSRFLSFLDFSLLLPLVSEAFARLGIPVPSWAEDEDCTGLGRERAALNLKTRDGRNCVLAGWVVVERVEGEVVEVRFVKVKGDPVEWRRLFKRVAVLCGEGVIRPE